MKKFFYRVCEGETVFSLSRKFLIPVGAIIDLNNLDREIESGDMLYLEKDCSLSVYTVDVLDTIDSVANKFGVSKQEIQTKNHIPYVFYGLTIFL